MLFSLGDVSFLPGSAILQSIICCPHFMKQIVIVQSSDQEIICQKYCNIREMGSTHSQLPCRMYRKSNCTTPSVGVGGGVDKMLKFYVKVFM